MPGTPPKGCWTLTLTSLLVVVVVTCVRGVGGQTANTVSEDGQIVWGELAPDQPYTTVDYTADAGGLDPYYALATSFIDTSLPETLPVATVKDILDGKASIGDKWQDLAKQFVGFALCVVIGFLFIFIFPIVACCFCCCRCCGNCGGKRIQHQGPNDKCKRIGFAIALTILSLFVLTGAACVFVTSDQLHKNLNGLNDSFSDAVDDFTTFADNIDQQFTRLGDTNFQYLSTVLKEYVDGASDKLSDDIISAINKEVNLDAPLNRISTLSDQALTEVSQLENQVDTLENQRDSAKTALAAIPCGTCLDAQITYLSNMDLAPISTSISIFKAEVSTDVFQEMNKELSAAIEAEVKKGTSSINVGTELDKIHQDDIQGMLDKVSDFKANLEDDMSSYQDQVEDLVGTIKPYDTYRWYAGVGLAALLGLLALMMLLGVCLGTCCGSVRDRPTERGGASNCGGICLMASVGLVFIFGALLMLLCTLMYMFGALTERYVCQSIDHLDRLEEYTNSFDFGTDLSNYTFTLNGETLYISLNDVMQDCKNDKTVYIALGLQGVVDSALDKIEGFKTNLNDINNINFGDAATAANGNVDVSTAIDNLKNTVTSIDTIKSSVTTMKTHVINEKNAAEVSSPGAGVHYNPMISTLNNMESTCTSLNSTAQAIEAAAINMNSNELPAATTKLDNTVFMTKLIESVTTAYTNAIFGFVDSYVNDMKLKLRDDVGKCTPFYSITNAILGEAVCHGIVDPMNGFWLALGWCLFFFLPSMILAVKLAKHYRTMLYEDSYDAATGSSPPPYYTQASGAPPKSTLFPNVTGSNNKVAPF